MLKVKLFAVLFSCKYLQLLGIMLSHTIFRITDNLSRALQSASLTALSACNLAEDVVKVLTSMRKDSQFDLFWERVDKSRAKLGNNTEQVMHNSAVYIT